MKDSILVGFSLFMCERELGIGNWELKTDNLDLQLIYKRYRIHSCRGEAFGE
ncbi:MAG: hypothetical protein F6K47_41590 [Symploca sp. SIO2E6]|nr:hypothetical protein [Symploca sp. SIO2E6]